MENRCTLLATLGNLLYTRGVEALYLMRSKEDKAKLTMRSLRRWTAPSSMGAETKQMSTHKLILTPDSILLKGEESPIRCTNRLFPLKACMSHSSLLF